MDSSWRRIAAPIITTVLTETHGRSEKEIRAALSQAYPFGEKAQHPYKIWLNEIRRQRGMLKAKLQRSRTGPYGAALEGQMGLFGEE